MAVAQSITVVPRTFRKPEVKSKTEQLIDREERAVASLLTRFRNLIALAAAPVSEEATKEVAASQTFQMEVEGQALIRATEDLLQLTRELKELWLFGTLRGIGEGVGDGNMDEDSKKVGEMIEVLLEKEAKGTGSS